LILSLASITKDEWIHQKHCSGAELWVHSMLFILHPMTLFIAGGLWPLSQPGIEPTLLSSHF